jgi:hypothetical protein
MVVILRGVKMNKENMNKILDMIDFMSPKTTINGFTFSRIDLEDVKKIEKLSDDCLLSEYDSYMEFIESSATSIFDLQLAKVYAFEIKSRNLEVMSKDV